MIMENPIRQTSRFYFSEPYEISQAIHVALVALTLDVVLREELLDRQSIFVPYSVLAESMDTLRKINPNSCNTGYYAHWDKFFDFLTEAVEAKNNVEFFIFFKTEKRIGS